MAENAISITELANRIYIGPNKTGDNIDANRLAAYQFNGTDWQRTPTGLVDVAYDDIVLSSYDVNGNPGTIEFKNAGSTVRTLTLTVDGNGNITEIARS